MEHTPEPWRFDARGIWQEAEVWTRARQVVSSCDDGYCDPVSKANAIRIVACVNACAGIPTDVLEANIIKDLMTIGDEHGTDYQSNH